MIISKTPVRISFLGGGTDYPQYFMHHSGAVISTAISHFCYVAFHNGMITKWFDLPEKAGLGTSSAFTVGLLRIWNQEATQREIAKLATIIEQEKMAGNIGVQDQLICSIGGSRLLRFSEAGTRDFEIDIEWLNPYLMLFNTHQYRMAGKIVSNQLKEMKHHTKTYERMLDIVEKGKIALDNKEFETFGTLLDESWSLKKQLSKYITTQITDEIYTKAIKSGAIGGKLLGAGGGGFMLFVAPLDKQESIKNELTNCEYISFSFEREGTKIIFKD